MKLVAQAIQNFNEAQIQALEKEGSLALEINNEKFTLEANDVIISTKDVPGWLVASEQGVTVALDIQMNENLRLEGMARELVNRLQNMRKDFGFDVTDTIVVTLKESEELKAILNENKAYIQGEILATTINVVKDVSNEAIELAFDSLHTQVAMVKS